MRKVAVHRAGGWGELRIEEHPDPTPRPNEVLIRTEAIGVNFADCVVRMGLYDSAKALGFPITPGFEIAGTVAAVGAGVESFSPGDDVFAVTRFGGYATSIAVPEAQVRRIPPGFSKAEAAAFSVVYLTAWYALTELCRLRPGMKLLVHSAAGGVGGALCQLARAKGCTTLGVVGSPHKVDVARGFGATEVVDRSQGDLWATAESFSPDGFDVVLDANGPATLRGSYDHLRPTGRLVVYGFHTMMSKGRGSPNWLKLAWDYLHIPRFNPLNMTNDNKSVLGFNLSYLFDRVDILAEGMDELLRSSEEGAIRPLPVKEFAFERVADAHRAIESGDTVGKLVLVV